MPPKNKKKNDEDEDSLMKAARFGRVKNTLSMGFVGLPNVGKSTLTNLLAGAMHAEAANYPFCTIDPNVVQCIVPDKNFRYLADCWKSPSVIPAVLKVTDIAGLIRGASEGAGLGNAFLSHIAAVDGIYHLVRAFDSDEIIHVDDTVDPIRDLETIQGELCAKDKDTLEKVLDREKEKTRKEKGLSRSADNLKLPEAFASAHEKVGMAIYHDDTASRGLSGFVNWFFLLTRFSDIFAFLLQCTALVEANTPIQTGDFTSAEVECIRDFGCITTKPQIYVINLSQKNFIRKGSKWLPKIKAWVDSHGGGQILPVSCEFEQKLFDLKDDKEGQRGESCRSLL
jgi:ribosome-binding ATPase YchF (GTP1/OBG family)